MTGTSFSERSKICSWTKALMKWIIVHSIVNIFKGPIKNIVDAKSQE